MMQSNFFGSKTIGVVLSSLTVSALAGLAGSAQAATLRLEGLTFQEAGGDYRITGGYTDNSFYTVREEVYGPNINLLMSIDGFPQLNSLGFRMQTIVTNLTGTPWIFFDNELRENINIPSPESDGLSFAQGIDYVRPFVSNRFSRADEVTDVRDFINFSNGIVNPGDTVTFQFAITDRSPVNRFYLLERPNFAPGGTGFVTVPPATPPAPPTPPAPVEPPPVTGPMPHPPRVPQLPRNPALTAPVAATPPEQPPEQPPVQSPVTQTPPSVTPSPSPTPAPIEVLPPVTPPAAAVPEPSTILGLLAAIGGGAVLKRGRRDQQPKQNP